jgi:hypothetical protein
MSFWPCLLLLWLGRHEFLREFRTSSSLRMARQFMERGKAGDHSLV